MKKYKQMLGTSFSFLSQKVDIFFSSFSIIRVSVSTRRIVLIVNLGRLLKYLLEKEATL